jgi:hypothetical protein
MKYSLTHRNVKSMITMERRDSEKVVVAAVPTSATYLEACSECPEWVAVGNLKAPRKASLSYTQSRPL